MARPKHCRIVGCAPGLNYFKPRGIPMSALEEVVLSIDELEALRLADLEGLYQEQAAAHMSVSRQTFGRIIESAHRKVAEALVNGKALRIEGGSVAITAQNDARCPRCRRLMSESDGDRQECPLCAHSKCQKLDTTTMEEKS